MFGGGGMNPRKLQQMMEQMGIDITEVDAATVRIDLSDGETLVFEDPEVTRMDAQGQQTYQVVGAPETVTDSDPAPSSEPAGEIPDGDIELVCQRTGVPREEARAALEATGGDLAGAIDRLS